VGGDNGNQYTVRTTFPHSVSFFFRELQECTLDEVDECRQFINASASSAAGACGQLRLGVSTKDEVVTLGGARR